MPSDRWRPKRRTVLGTAASGVAIALAGCVGDSDGDDGTDDTNDVDADDADPDGGDDDQEAEQLDSPTEFPEGEECAVCSMVTPEYPEWNAQLVKEDGTRVYFCSSGCMLAYYANPEQFDGDDEPVENAWVTDYETGELIDGRECYYARVEDSDHVDDIMMMNPTPFADREDAEAFIDELNDEFDAGYDPEADIITFDEFDMELAMLYRGRFFEENGDDGHNHDDDDGHNHDDDDGHDHDDDDGHDHGDDDGHDH